MLKIDMHSNKPIYEQIVDTVKEQVIKGILKEGDQLPSVRQLARLLTINPNTVSRAYQELERQKVIETLRGKGTFICNTQIDCRDEEKLLGYQRKLKDICMSLHYMGVDEEEVGQWIREIYRELKGEN